MKKTIRPAVQFLYFAYILMIGLLSSLGVCAQETQDDLKVVLIRHAEKPIKGGNLTCQGFNRSLQLPALLKERFGIPSAIYIPSIGMGDSTKHSRMFQTIIPFAVKYNLALISKWEENDSAQLAGEIRQHKKGTVLIIWEHKRIPSIARALGIIDDTLRWPDDDYDSIWILTFKNGSAQLEKEKEGLHPSSTCSF